MATKSVATKKRRGRSIKNMQMPENAKTETPTTDDTPGEDLEFFNNVIDGKAAAAIFKAMSVLSLGIEATMDRSLCRAHTQWPNVAETVWDMLDGIMIRAGASDGKDRPWVSANEAEAARTASGEA